MCGIAGIFNYGTLEPPDPEVLRRMARAMAHRGPDGEGIHVSGPCGLAHRRLSIIDLAGGRQPLSNEDGSVWVSFNGEIYNYRPLAADLGARGHAFRTRSDTETIVHAYEEDGDRCVERLQGMFAFAIWDGARRRLLLARDRAGVKPLYYRDDGARIVFASEISALLEHPAVRRAEDREAARLFLAFGFVPAPRTGLEGVRKLPPAHVLVCWQGRRPALRRYWRRPLRGGRGDGPAAAAAALDALLRRTVASHLQSDVPLGVLLSGGIDSTAILAHAARRAPGRMKTFSVYFGEGGARYDETPMARLAAREVGAEHHELRCTPERFLAEVPHFIRHMEEPVIEAAAVPLLALSRLVRRHVTVVLSGEGADEDFGGYEIYRHMLALEGARRLVPRALRGLGARALDAAGLGRFARWARLADLPLERRYRGVSLPDRDALAPLLEPGLAGEIEAAAAAAVEPVWRWTDGAHPLERMMALDLELWLPDDILLKADKMTMAASIELRVPFLDPEVIELAASLAPALLVDRRRGKLVLRDAARGLVPRLILERPKRGFPTPVAHLLRSTLGRLAERVLAGPDACGHGLWSPARAARALAEHRSGRADRHRPLWMILVYELWHRAMVRGESLEEPAGDAASAPRAAA